MVPADTGCACPGDVLTYTCTVIGAGSTLWTGTLFDCPANGSTIILQHDSYRSGGAVGECNNGAVIAQSVAVVDDCYSSQLTFTASDGFNNKTIQCTHISNNGSIAIGSSFLSVVNG